MLYRLDGGPFDGSDVFELLDGYEATEEVVHQDGVLIVVSRWTRGGPPIAPITPR